jgi:hypothetical protein
MAEGQAGLSSDGPAQALTVWLSQPGAVQPQEGVQGRRPEGNMMVGSARPMAYAPWKVSEGRTR